MKRQPIGIDDYKHIIDNDLYFVDKTLFIKEIIDDGAMVTLITRPRRFGKTLNMSLLKYYFEKVEEDNSYLFKDYKVWQQGEKYRNEFAKYPVITLTLKSAKYFNWEDNYDMIKNNIASEYRRHDYVLKSNKLSAFEKETYDNICKKKCLNADYGKSLEFLSEMLYKHYNQKVIILIDEYDTLLNEAYIHGFWKKAIEFMKVFVNEGFKNNLYLHKGIITGIFRVAKESIFSDMNNLKVCTILSNSYKEYFGFTEEEVIEMMKYYNIEEKIEQVASWYNGYIFGETKTITIYNPWSIIMYMNNQILKPYWINTSGNEIIRKIAIEGSKEIQYRIQDIIEGKEFKDVKVYENIVYNEILKSERSIWSFILMSGYLKSVKTTQKEDGVYCDLKAPNKEVYYFFRNMLENWLDETVKGGSVSEMLKALLTGDIETFYEIFARTVKYVLSYNDVTEDRAESFYHAFVLGMLVNIDEEYEIKSNRESGYGRYDVSIIPKDISKKGIIIEFKKVSELSNDSIEKAMEMALKQIEEKQYEAELRQRGVSDIVKLGIVFKGKEVRIEQC